MLVVGAATASACVTTPDPFAAGSTGHRPPAVECGAPSFSCNLPFPSDSWLIPDPSTPTGVRLEVPTGAVSAEIIAKFGARDQLAEATVNADGFSPVIPVAFQLPEGLKKDAVPADGGELVQVWDLTTGERVRIHAEVSQHLHDERGVSNIIVAYPATRFEPGHRIFAGVTTGVPAGKGGLATASPSKVLASPATKTAAATVTPGISWDDYLSATSFTVRSEGSIVDDVDRMASIIREADHPFRNVSVVPPVFGGGLMVTGEVRSLDFRERDGFIARDGSATPKERWLEFVMVLPERPATPAGAPVVVYGHGIVAFKETMLVVAAQNANKGFATIAIDKPNHGTRSGSDGGHITELIWPSNLNRVQSLLLQASLDDLSLIAAITQHGAEFDLWPNQVFGASGDGQPDLDTESLHYLGTSLGGVLGATVIGLAPEIDAAYLQVPGAGIIDTLFHSLVWGIFQSIVPSNATYGDNHVLTFFAQNLLDRADSANYLTRIRDRGTPVFISYGLDDGLVRNQATERMIGLLDLPLVGRQWGPLPAPLLSGAKSAMPTDGRGFSQVPTDQIPESFAKPLLTHLSFTDPLSSATLDAWLDARTAIISE